MRTKHLLNKLVASVVICTVLMSLSSSSVFALDSAVNVETRKNAFYSSLSNDWGSRHIVKCVKKIVDFDGNPYVVIEYAPTGYIILNEEVGVIMEEGENSPSPYLYVETGIYGGPTRYYTKEKSKNEIQHTITNEKLSLSEITSLRKLCKDAQVKLKTSYVDDEIVSYLNDELDNQQDMPIKAAATNSYISSGKSFFTNLNTKTKMGYYSVGDGACGYVASAMVLLYYDKYKDGNFIVNSTYLNSTGNAYKSNAFTKMLYNEIGKATLGYSNSLNASQVAKVMTTYLKNKRNINATCWSATMVNHSSIRYQLTNRDIPVVYVDRFNNPQSGGTVDHDIVIYGYDSAGGLISHFGWVGYEHVKCTSPATALFISSACAITYY